jgi:hypothetical protein
MASHRWYGVPHVHRVVVAELQDASLTAGQVLVNAARQQMLVLVKSTQLRSEW